MEVFKCLICGDPYIGSDKPTHCPFCGALTKYMVLASDWDVEEFDPSTLSEVSKANLEHALMIEMNNALFYKCSYEVALDVELASMFKALHKVEAEHASVIRKLLGLPKTSEEEDTRGRCHAIEIANLQEAHTREKRAIDFYSRAAEVSVEPRVKEVFTALTEIETTHIELNEKSMSVFTQVSGNPAT